MTRNFNTSPETSKIKDRLMAASAAVTIGAFALVGCSSPESDQVNCEVVAIERNDELFFNVEGENMETDDYEVVSVSWTFGEGNALLNVPFGEEVTNDYSDYKDGSQPVDATMSMIITSNDPYFTPPWGKGGTIPCDGAAVEIDNNYY